MIHGLKCVVAIIALKLLLVIGLALSMKAIVSATILKMISAYVARCDGACKLAFRGGAAPRIDADCVGEDALISC